MNENSSATRLVYTRLFFWLIAILGIAAFALLLASAATQFLYFARVPLVSLTLFAGIVPFLAIHNLKSLLIGTYDLIGFQDGTSGNGKGLGVGVALGLVLVL